MPLSDLASALAAATGPSRDLDERLAVEVFGWREYNEVWWPADKPGDSVARVPAYTASLDAITAAVKARWGCVWIKTRETPTESGAELGVMDYEWQRPLVDRPGSVPLALCLAAVRLAMGER